MSAFRIRLSYQYPALKTIGALPTDQSTSPSRKGTFSRLDRIPSAEAQAPAPTLSEGGTAPGLGSRFMEIRTISETIESRIVVIRGQRVLLDVDLALLYGVETKALNRAVKRNIERFPGDFMFQLTANEVSVLRCQSGTSKGSGGRRYLPFVFTEHGVAMLSSVLHSPRAIQVNIQIMQPEPEHSDRRAIGFTPKDRP